MTDIDNHQHIYTHSWNYFSLHATQRMTTFNFFIALATVETTAIAILISTDQYIKLSTVGVLLGFTLCITSFIFWKLDKRVSNMIKIAENALIQIESTSQVHEYKIFTQDKSQFDNNRKKSIFTKNLWTYGDAHRVIFLICGTLGIGSSLFIIFKSIIS